MNVGIVGLGLIGGSFAKAFKAANDKVYVFNRSQEIVDFAIMKGDVDYKLDKSNMSECDLIIVSLYPNSTIDFLNDYSQYFNKNAVVIDACGTKRAVCECGFENAKKYGYTFIGAHPMAGTHNSGYKYSKADMFKNAPMVLVPPVFDDIELLDRVEKMLSPCKFGSFTVTSAEKHDEMIAFTSQMPHIVSNAFIKSPTAGSHKGFSAGSYKDLTRVAWLNPVMWSDLFFENKDCLIKELDIYIEHLKEYKNALEKDDEEYMIELLQEGKQAKEKVDGRWKKLL